MDIAIALSEFKRIKVFIIALFVGLIIMGINFFAIKGTTDFFKKEGTEYYVIGWFMAFLIYELIGFFIAKKFLNKKVVVPSFMKISNVIIESAFPGVLLFILSYREQSVIFLDSPVMFFYFIFIVLTVLNLEKRISLIVGLITSGSYLFVTYWAINSFDLDHSILDFPPGLYYARSFFMLLAALCSTFITIEIKKRYKASLGHKQKRDEIERLFDQQVSKEVANLLLKDSSSSRRDVVSILFLDIRNYSTFAESKTPEEVIDFQNNFFSPILRIINRFNGITNQIMGDGLMATFGAPIHNKEHAQQAYEAALTILEKVDMIIGKKIIPSTRIGIGIHSGEVVMGNIGNELRKQFSISGTVVVLASRIEQANKIHKTKLLISKATRKQIDIKGKIVESIGKLKMKNITKEIELFKVVP
jgi:adenylate cyclase